MEVSLFLHRKCRLQGKPLGNNLDVNCGVGVLLERENCNKEKKK